MWVVEEEVRGQTVTSGWRREERKRKKSRERKKPRIEMTGGKQRKTVCVCVNESVQLVRVRVTRCGEGRVRADDDVFGW